MHALTILQFCQKSSELAVLNLFIHHQLYIKTMCAAAASIIQLKYQFKQKHLHQIRDELAVYKSSNNATNLQVFQLESELESINKKLSKKLKPVVEQRLCLEKANIESALECKRNVINDVQKLIVSIENKMPEILTLLGKNQWTRAFYHLNAENVD